MYNIDNLISEILQDVIEIQKNLNSIPELAFNEYKTQNYIKNILNNVDIQTIKCADTGLIGVLNDGPTCIAIRADMDAIVSDGNIMHACGHDYHMSIAIGVAMTLKKMGFDRCVKFIFQPGEEGSGGAKKMIDEGVLEKPQVQALIGLHVWPNLEVGKIALNDGPIMASVDDFELTFIGKGGHAAMPQDVINPIYPAIDTIQTINNIMLLRYDKFDPVHISFSSITAGSLPNVVPSKCIVKGTVRTYNDQLREKIHNNINEIANLAARKYECSCNFIYNYQYPALINHKELANQFIEFAKNYLGNHNVEIAEPSFTAEDFSFYCKKVPSIYFRLGIKEEDIGTYPLHSSNFSASKKSLYYGIKTLVGFILHYYQEEI
ncbi:M20 family metallopeptidase [Caldicellulosiruptoraceae bacterium PP1]